MIQADWDAIAQRLGYRSEQLMWEELYLDQHISVLQLASRFGITAGTVSFRLKKSNVTTRSRGGNNRVEQRPKWLHLWRFDQRLLFCFPRGILCQVTRVAEGTLIKYLNAIQEKSNGSSAR